MSHDIGSSLVVGELGHQGCVADESDPDRGIPNQPNAQDVVSEAMDRATLGLPASIRWYSSDFADSFLEKSGSKEAIKVRVQRIQHFERKLYEGVRGIVDSFAADGEHFYVHVGYIGKKCFRVVVIRLDKMMFPPS